MMLATFSFSIDSLKEWVLQHGWWPSAFGSFLLLFTCGLGVPVPEDVPLIITGALLCRRTGDFSAWHAWVIVASLNWLGIMLGDTCLYWISRRLGRAALKLPLIRNHVTIERIDKMGGFFSRYGVLVVGVGRLLAGIRGAMVMAAGITRFGFGKFILADGLAAVVSGGLFMLLGHYVGENLNDATIHKFKHWFVIGAVVLALLVALWIVYKLRSHPPQEPAA